MPAPLLGRAIRCRHSAVDEERGGRVVARHISSYVPVVLHNFCAKIQNSTVSFFNKKTGKHVISQKLLKLST